MLCELEPKPLQCCPPPYCWLYDGECGGREILFVLPQLKSWKRRVNEVGIPGVKNPCGLFPFSMSRVTSSPAHLSVITGSWPYIRKSMCLWACSSNAGY